ncbi:phage holin family protein [Halomonas sp. LS-001]
MASGPGQRTFDAAKRLLRTLLANGETRLRLAVLELEEERARLLTLMLLAGASLVLLLLGVATLTALVIILFWDTYRIAAIAISAGVLITISLILALTAIRKARQHTMFKETLKQFSTDRALLELEQDANAENKR